MFSYFSERNMIIACVCVFYMYIFLIIIDLYMLQLICRRVPKAASLSDASGAHPCLVLLDNTFLKMQRNFLKLDVDGSIFFFIFHPENKKKIL